jgi:uncharacterized protein (TIGR02996 family)
VPTVTQDEAFLRAILDDPDDDAPRLVYADWLDEHGDPARAEFIRTQCLLARMGEDDPGRPFRVTRERALLDGHLDEWLGPRPLASGWVFRRGFLDALTVPAAVYLGHPTLPVPATVRRVEVDPGGFDIPEAVLDLVPESIARGDKLVGLGYRGGKFVLAMRDPDDPAKVDRPAFIFNRAIEAVAAREERIATAVRRHYGPPPDDGDERAARLFRRILANARKWRLNEIRIEPGPDRVGISYVNGAGRAYRETCPRWLLTPLISSIRIASSIWLDDPRDVQRGSFRLTAQDTPVNVGVLIRRTDEGPAAVLTLQPDPAARGAPPGPGPAARRPPGAV